jgi:RNA polymerase sigma-70 factor (ECF subfamily)
VNGDEPDIQTTQSITYNSLYQYINELVDQLPERRKEIFIKSRFEGQSIKEIAEELMISHKTVENQLTDALKFIRTNLNRESLSLILFYLLFLS